MLDQPGLFYSDVIEQNGKFLGDKPAVICGDEMLSWAQFDRRTNQVANALIEMGLKKGDKVCLFMQSSIAMFELLWGTIKAGGVIVPLNVMMAKESLPLMVNSSDGRFLFADATTRSQVDAIRARFVRIGQGQLFTSGGKAEGWASAEELVAVASAQRPFVPLVPSDSMSIIYSSGSTGVPKGIEHSHFARLAYPLGTGPSLKIDRYAVPIATTPLYTNGTWITMLPAVYWGSTMVLMPKFSAVDFLTAVERHGCTHVFMVPTQYIVICAEPSLPRFDVSSLKVLLSGGQPLTTTTYGQMQKCFPKAGISEIYGMTEGFLTVALPEDFAAGQHGSVGKPIFGADLCVLDQDGNILPPGQIGEIAGWSPALMKGYYHDAARTQELIWQGPYGRTYIRSGDVGRIDEQGFIYISGRIKDMIKSGGINVFASDIEEVFMRHPAVKEVAAVGVPHDKWGETPLLFVILQDGMRIGAEELMAWGNAQLGKFQRVSAVEFRDEFPRATHDKVLKRALRDPYWQGRERKI